MTQNLFWIISLKFPQTIKACTSQQPANIVDEKYLQTCEKLEISCKVISVKSENGKSESEERKWGNKWAMGASSTSNPFYYNL